MASSGVLIADVALAFGLDVGTVTTFMQRLRENNMIHFGGRGTSAEPMEASDASTLLAAILAGEPISEAPAAAKAALAMPRLDDAFFDHRSDTTPFWAGINQETETSPEDERHTATFGAALRHLITCAERYVDRRGRDTRGWEDLFDQTVDMDRMSTAEIEHELDADKGCTPLPVRVTYCRRVRLAFIDLHVRDISVRRFVFANIPAPDIAYLRGEPPIVARRLFPDQYRSWNEIDGSHILAVARSLQKPIDTTRNRRSKK